MNAFKSKYLTIRSVPPDIAEALGRAKRRYHLSLNQTVLDALRRGLDLDQSRPHSNGLRRLAGTWNDHDLERFNDATEPTRQIDEELWR